MARTVDIYCNVCKSKAVITKADRIHKTDFNRLYCSCCNPKCQHKFVVNQEFSHTTKTSLLTKKNFLKLLIGQLSEDDKEELRQELSA